jgi:dipeptidyl aminopeptidase/acylaminoacyl peptidase
MCGPITQTGSTREMTVRTTWLASALLWATGCVWVAWEPPPAPYLPVPPARHHVEPHADEPDDVPEPTPEPAAKLIPRRSFFGNPEKTSPQLSPDGKHLSFLAPSDGVLNVWVAPVDDLGAAKAITHSKKRPIRRFFWSYDNQHVLYMQDKGGDENWRVFSVRLSDGKEVDLTPIEGVQAQIQERSDKIPGEILVALNDRDPRFHDIHRVDVETGKRTLVIENNDKFGSFVTDDDFQVRLAIKPTDDGGKQILRFEKDKFVPFLTVGLEDEMTTDVLGFDESGKTLYLLDSRKRDTAALVQMPATGGRAKVLFSAEKADIADVLMHPKTHAVQGVGSNRLRKQWQFKDAAVEADMAVLAKVARGDVLINSRSLDDRKWTVIFVSDDGPARFYLFDRDAQAATFLFADRPGLEKLDLAEMHPVTIPARDGLELVSYLTLPAAIAADRPAHPLPMVLLVHGGPWSRDEWGYNSMHQWLASRGYAVLSVNFRGSTGFGKAFTNAGDKQWAGTMHHDLLDAVAWAVKEGIAIEDKVAIMGGSYGGYATLVGLTFTPDTFACGVDIVGPSNLVTLLETIPPYWAPARAMFHKRLGDPTTEHGRKDLENRSPLRRADKITRPLLIGQGKNDPRVKQAESDQIVTAMKSKNIPVTYVLYPDEGHGFARPENRLSFNAVAEAFLGECLGGDVEPPGADLAGSSIEVPAGVVHIPGLEAALRGR